MEPKIPTWIMVWTFIIAMLPLGFVLQGYLDPGAHFGEEAAAAGAATYAGPIGLYIARNAASVVVTLFAFQQRSAPMLIVILMLRAVTDVFDVIHNAVAGTVGAELMIFATLWITGSSIAIFKLWNWPTSSEGDRNEAL